VTADGHDPGNAGEKVGVPSSESAYALALSDDEVRRYQAMAEGAVTAERELWALAGIITGATVADIGCGPSAEAAVLAEAVGPSGRVYGVDADPQAVRLATEVARRSGFPQVSIDVADAAASGLPAGSVDVAMIRNVLAHNGGREQEIVDHLAGLVRPGGCVYLVDADGLAVRARPVDPDLEDLRGRYSSLHSARGNDVQIGLRLAELLEAAGLEVISFTGRYAILPLPAGARGPAWAARNALIEAGMADAADVELWDAAYQRVDSAPRPQTIFVPVFIGIGRRVG
jgi:SAM-dependent methyltransferase